MAGRVRHRQAKGPVTVGPRLNHRATSRLYSFFCRHRAGITELRCRRPKRVSRPLSNLPDMHRKRAHPAFSHHLDAVLMQHLSNASFQLLADGRLFEREDNHQLLLPVRNGSMTVDQVACARQAHGCGQCRLVVSGKGRRGKTMIVQPARVRRASATASKSRATPKSPYAHARWRSGRYR